MQLEPTCTKIKELSSIDWANFAYDILRNKLGKPLTIKDIQMIRKSAHAARAKAIQETANSVKGSLDLLSGEVDHLVPVL